jgi:hypothetical protein
MTMTIVVNFLSVVNRLSKVQWLSKFNVAVQLLTGLGVGIAPTITVSIYSRRSEECFT